MRLVILGAGGYGQTVADMARQLNKYSEILFLDDNKTDAAGKCSDYPLFADGNTEMYPAFGNNEVRLNFIKKLVAANIPVATIIHPTAYISPTAKIDHGTAVLAHASVNTDCRVKSGCIINIGAVVDHGCVIEEGVHVCLNAAVKAENRIPALMKIEACEVIQNRKYPL